MAPGDQFGGWNEEARRQTLEDEHERLTRLQTERWQVRRTYWRDFQPPPGYDSEPSLLFLGTGGNPMNTVVQARQTGGFALMLPECFLYVDPGPGAIVHARRHGLDLRALDALYISHGHTDHVGGAAPVVEAMTGLMGRHHGLLLASARVFEDRLISDFHQGKATSQGYGGGPSCQPLKEGEEISVGKAGLRPVRAHHGPDNFGFILETPTLTIGYTSDSNYLMTYRTRAGAEEAAGPRPLLDYAGAGQVREDLRAAFAGVDVLIANVAYHNLWASRHLTDLGLAHLLQGSQVRRCFMTHFDTACCEPADLTDDMAAWVTAASGVPAVAAKDNARYRLDAVTPPAPSNPRPS